MTCADVLALQVTFEPGNPYRRKSSLVSSEVRPQIKPRPTKRDECLVHQFLESQRRANGAAGGDKDTEHFRAHPIYTDPQGNVNGTDGKFHEGMERLVEPKTHERHNSRATIDAASLEDNNVGQEDQQAWTKEMTKSMSELDLAQYQEEIHSRTLTKRQLSDMAWGVRELSRRLSSMRIRFRVKSVFILTKIYDQDLIPKTRQLAKWLLSKDRDVAFTVYIQDKLKTNKKFDVEGLIDELAQDFAADGQRSADEAKDAIKQRIRYWDEPMCRTRPHIFDFVITLGGDGTVLYASWLFQRIVPPVLSFALGSLGFLTKFDFEEHEAILGGALKQGVTVSLRLRFEGTVMRSQRKLIENGTSGMSSSEEDDEEKVRDLVEELIGEEKEDAHTHRPDGTYEILNEIVVDRGPNPTMSYTEIFGDDEHFTSVLADGICVSTPTGSTAYNLAAGGSLCHPENPVMLVTSICPHTLSFRPIILPDTVVLRVGVPYDARTSSWASFDGRERVELRPGDYVTISASRYPFASVQAEGRRSEDWVNSISGKLGWNTRQKQKGYKEWDK
ncbi:putative NAD kinase [Sarocladium strictum]